MPNLLSRALATAGYTHTEADIAEGVACGDFQRWELNDSVIITEVRDTPKHRYVHFFLAEGKMDELQVMTPMILDWARMHGCTRASLCGRKGWERVPWLRDSGWQHRHVVLERDL